MDNDAFQAPADAVALTFKDATDVDSDKLPTFPDHVKNSSESYPITAVQANAQGYTISSTPIGDTIPMADGTYMYYIRAPPGSYIALILPSVVNANLPLNDFLRLSPLAVPIANTNDVASYGRTITTPQSDFHILRGFSPLFTYEPVVFGVRLHTPTAAEVAAAATAWPTASGVAASAAAAAAASVASAAAAGAGVDGDGDTQDPRPQLHATRASSTNCRVAWRDIGAFVSAEELPTMHIAVVTLQPFGFASLHPCRDSYSCKASAGRLELMGGGGACGGLSGLSFSASCLARSAAVEAVNSNAQ